MQINLKIADTIKSTLKQVLGATAYDVISSHIQSMVGINFSRPETVISNARDLEEFLHRIFRDSAATLLHKVDGNLFAAFPLPDDYTFQYSQVGYLAALIEKILKRHHSFEIISNAHGRDYFTMSYSHEDEFPSIIAAFLQRGIQNIA